MLNSKNNIFKAALVDSLPVMMGYLSMGTAFGVLLTARVPGANAGWAALMSAATISGSMQFAAVEMLAHGAAYSLGLVAMLALLINIRYAMYGIGFVRIFRNYPWYVRYYLILCLTDETYALESSTSRRGTARCRYCLWVSFLDHMYWLAGSVIGALAGAFISFDTTGIDFAMTALFLVILVDLVRVRANRIPALAGGAATLAALCFFVGFFPAQVNKMLLAAMALMIALLLGMRRRLERKPPEADR